MAAVNNPLFFVAVHLGPLGKVVMVLGGLHSRLSDVPDSIPYVPIDKY